jgi:hypothetical protein
MPQAITSEGASPSPKNQVAGLGSKAFFSSLAQTASREFLASAQLLAERVRFVTGAANVAVALKEDGKFIYRASCGSSGHEPGAPVNLASKAVRQCMEDRETTLCSTGGEGKTSLALCVPILKGQDLAGFFEVSAGHEFRDKDIEAVTRLSQMIITALEHQEAARSLESRGWNVEPATEANNKQAKADVPTLWHAEGQAATLPEVQKPALPLTSVSGCQSCGFPVSVGRVLCLDCEARLPSSDLVPRNEIFSQQPQESWISAHGYTIASLIVTAVAAAIIYWLR